MRTRAYPILTVGAFGGSNAAEVGVAKARRAWKRQMALGGD